MNLQKIQEKDFELILQIDKKVYPTSSPVTKDIIKSWYTKNSEFGMIFQDKNKIVGNFIVIPLNKNGWERLIKCKLKESQMNSRVIFDNSRDREICLHVYHIEKFDKNINHFYKIALKELSKLIKNLKINNKNLKIGGFSGLCVTLEGLELFENKFKCKEREFLVQEHILEKNGKKFVAESLLESNQKKNENYNYLNPCKMLVLFPKEKSIVWNYLK